MAKKTENKKVKKNSKSKKELILKKILLWVGLIYLAAFLSIVNRSLFTTYSEALSNVEVINNFLNLRFVPLAEPFFNPLKYLIASGPLLVQIVLNVLFVNWATGKFPIISKTERKLYLFIIVLTFLV